MQALSGQAEPVLGCCEEEAINRPVGELLGPAAAEERESDSFSGLLLETACGSRELGYTYVRPRNTFGVRLRARVCACGPPPAALVALSSPSLLRSV